MLKRLLRRLAPHWLQVVAAGVSTLLVMALNLAIPQLIRVVIDSVLLGGQVSLLPWIAGGVIAITVIKGFFSYWDRFLMERVSQKITYNLRNELYDHLQHLPFAYYENAQTGQLMTSDVDMLKRFFGFGFIHLFQGLVTFVGVVIVIFSMHRGLSLLTLATLPFIVVTILYFGRRVGPAFQKIQESLADLTSALQENLSGIRVVKAFNREDGEAEKFDHKNKKLLARNLTAVRLWAFFFPLMSFLTGLAAAAILWYGGREVIAGNLQLGELIAFNSYLLLMIMPMRMLGWVVNLAQRSFKSAERVFAILDTKIQIADAADAIELESVTGRVTFDNVSFAYREDTPALVDISFSAEAGQTIAIVGTTGSGKTTLVNLVPRFYDPSKGAVLIDGEDIRHYTLQSLRRAVGLVTQDTFLYSATIADNIGYGDDTADRTAIEAAAQAAQIDEFIVSLPNGYDTLVGERGVNLSGGQKQRISIARALLKNPKILILDDYTSSVDTHTEYLIRQALDVLMKGRTSFVIAQRIATVLAADLILVLDGGRIVARGQHRELLQTSSLYREIYEIQYGSRSHSNKGGETEWTT
ncbi:MAG: ABC transporter ATP-binding protein/permease [Firmicutes bacterium]|nr:ABC transporter ATP-binding protein/permease [Bacillota bacterium]